MTFRELKPGDTLYIYDRAAVELTTQTIASVSAPRMERIGNVNAMFVDVKTDTREYAVKDTAEITYSGSLTISADKALILKEVEQQRLNDETLLTRVEAIKAELPKLEAITDQLNPEQKQKKVQEERLNKLEQSLGDIKEMLELAIKNNKVTTTANGTK